MILFFLLAATCLAAENLTDTSDVIALPSLQESQKNADPLLIANLKSILLLGKQNDNQKCPDMQGVDWIDLIIPGHSNDLRKQLSFFLNKSVTIGILEEIEKVISNYYTTNNHPFVVLEVPEQDVTSGSLQLIVTESRLGGLFVEGNRWTSSETIKQYFRIKPGDLIDESDLIQTVSFINRNPFRRSDLIFQPGAAEHTTDVIVSTIDRRPFRIYTGANNLGMEPIGTNQWYAGFNWGHAFGLDHTLSYQYTAAFNVGLFQAHTAEYTALLSWGHLFKIYGGYSEVHPHVPQPFKRNDGWNMQVSARYVVPLEILRYLEREVSVGVDFKRTNNTFEFTEQFPVFGNNVNLTQLVLECSGNYERNSFRLDFNGSLYCSPGRLVADQTNDDYDSLRPGAVNRWIYFYGYFTYLQRLPKSFSFNFRAAGQGSTSPLLPSEQFGLGGYETVRGYEENEVTVDNAVALSVEARSPAMPIAKWIKPTFKVPDGLQFLIFFDYGWGLNKETIPGTQNAVYLMGAGPGCRYTLEPYLTARLDWGIRLHDKPWFTGNWDRIHFNVTASF